MTIDQVDDLVLFGVVRDHLNAEALPEFNELERRYWRHLIGEMAAQQGLTLAQFFQARINEAD